VANSTPCAQASPPSSANSTPCAQAILIARLQLMQKNCSELLSKYEIEIKENEESTIKAELKSDTSKVYDDKRLQTLSYTLGERNINLGEVRSELQYLLTCFTYIEPYQGLRHELDNVRLETGGEITEDFEEFKEALKRELSARDPGDHKYFQNQLRNLKSRCEQDCITVKSLQQRVNGNLSRVGVACRSLAASLLTRNAQVSNMLVQRENKFSRDAKSRAARDSDTMKILAFFTAFLLPATLFAVRIFFCLII
jgi:hypothetical protein